MIDRKEFGSLLGIVVVADITQPFIFFVRTPHDNPEASSGNGCCTFASSDSARIHGRGTAARKAPITPSSATNRPRTTR